MNFKWLKRSLALATLFACGAFAAFAQTGETISPEAKAYLTSALDIMQKNSLLKREVNWEELRRKAFEKAAGARDSVDTWDAIRFALKLIGDHHSFLQLTGELQAKEDARRQAAKTEIKPTDNKPPSPYIPRRQPEGFIHRIGASCVVGRLVVPLYPRQQGDDYATALNKFIAETEAKENVCGWIVDLRGNAGGNVFPMLAGVGALLDEGDASFAIDAEGGKTAFFYKNGQAGLREPDGKETIVAKITGGVYKVKRQLPVAVLIDKGTASSGEGIAIAFRGRKNTRFFGAHTFGVSTSNEGFLLSDGANMVLTTGVGADKNGNRYFSGIDPDETIPTADKMLPPSEDAAIHAALGWLAEQTL